MFDTLDYSAFKTGYGGKQIKESAAFAMDIRPGQPLRDRVSGVEAICNIPGDRWGVVNGIVTRIPAYKPAVVDGGLRVCPAFTQLAKISESVGCGLGSARMSVPVFHEVFNGVNIWKFIEDTTYNSHNMPPPIMASVADNSMIGMSCVAKYNGRHLEIKAQGKDAVTRTVCFVNLQTGAITSLLSVANVAVSTIENGYYRIFCSLPSFAGEGSTRIYHQLYDGATSLYLGNGTSGIYMGQVTFINFGEDGIPFIPPYVPNNTTSPISVVSEAATATNGTSFDFDNIKLTRSNNILRGPHGHLEIIVKSNTDSAWWTNNSTCNVLSVNNAAASVLYVYKGSDGSVSFRTTDGANIASVAQSMAVGITYKISIDWGTHSTGQKMQLTVNGVKSSLADFSGSLGLKDLLIGFGNTIDFGCITRVEVYDRPAW